MKSDELLEKLLMLEYHQKILLRMVQGTALKFDWLIVKRGLSEEQINLFFEKCEKMSMDLEQQKAEGFLYFHPLFQEFSAALPSELEAQETISACIEQGLFLPLMLELKKYC